MTLNTIQKFRALHIVNHIVSLAALYWAFTTTETVWPWALAGFAFFLWTGIVGVNVALHRYYAHRAFETTPFRERILLISSIITSLGSPAMWCSVHRLHHTSSDTERDPHNPARDGVFRTWFTLWKPLYMPKRHIKPFLEKSDMRWVHQHYFAINFVVLIALALIDWRLAAFVYCLPAVGCFHGAAAIGVLPHLQGRWQIGYRRYEVKDLSHNNWLASVLALGEGWHNNHHANPGRWYQGEVWWEIDPPAFMIKHFFMKKNAD